ncbi:hypothetical protein [Acetobacter conturbans]|uniref:hypothetical protein n=1 Tax=Acetobacter conturbans TaxID=1737472 RepID=UPI001F5568A2|nr:hypothetical protein [Acetobacter conturbans]
MRGRIAILAIGCFIIGSSPALAQEEDSDYKDLMRKVTTNTTCMEYLNDEHDDYSGDKMAESLSPDEVTKGLSKAIRDECEKAPKESVSNAVSKVKMAYNGRLSEMMNKIKSENAPIHGKGGV